ncbi:hypothetical protein ACFSX9_03925 [Flavobacterium ardleyense]|uniref:Uncharacterized protein n=1 Tax=Flavobacterium ardleyense TaxID=2038737 RepID=A0ABW5Z725_9FLAO
MYQFKFENGETEKVKNFDEFCDLIITKVNFENVESCTTQQAFYKLRISIVEERIYEKEKIKLETELKIIFPRSNRIKLVKKLEKNIGLELNVLSSPKSVIYSLTVILLVSIFMLFINFLYGIIGIGISVYGFYCCKWFGKELEIKNVKELVEKMTTENYLNIRSKKNTVNKSELKVVVTDWFVENAGIEKEKLKTSTFI